MSANLYDLLDVDESASAEEVRAAWKSAIADLDPTERRFRAYNDAAGVLLDADKRAAYDAELARERAAEEAEDLEPEVVAEPAESEPVDGSDVDEPEPLPAKAEKPAKVEKPAKPVKVASDGPARPALIAAAVAAVLAVALAIWIFTLPGVRADESPKAVADRSTAQQKAALSVEGAAERLVAPVLSYNHATMDEDLKRLKDYVTTKMADKQAKAWPDLTTEAIAQKIVVEAKASGTGLTRVDADGKRATVVVFIDQYVEKTGAQPFVLHMWATLEMVRASGSEDGWLLDNLCTDDSCA